jgi:PKHD-type hydroxylase
MSYNYKTISNYTKDRSETTYPYSFWNDLFNEEEISNILNYIENKELLDGAVESKNLEDSKSADLIDKIVRDSKISFHFINEENNWIFSRINNLIEVANDRWYNFDINGYDFLQYGEYHGTTNGNYDWHTDLIFGSRQEGSNFSETRKMSISLLLNDPSEFEGGELEFKCGVDELIPDMKKGTAIIFPSFMLHRVRPVTKGIRKSLVIWTLGPKFK